MKNTRDVIRKYRERLQTGGLNNVGDVFERNTVEFTNLKFTDSPTHKYIQLEDANGITDSEARIIEVERLGSLREAVFRPYTKVTVGTYLIFDNDKWLIFDNYGAGISPKSIIAVCNRDLNWIDENGDLKSFKCVASSADIGSKSKQSRNEITWNKYDVSLPEGQLFIFVQSNEDTKKIDINQRFILGSKAYEVVGYDDVTSIDREGNGLIQYTVKVTTLQNGDDIDNQIAVNGRIDSDGNPTDDKDKGGRIW